MRGSLCFRQLCPTADRSGPTHRQHIYAASADAVVLYTRCKVVPYTRCNDDILAVSVTIPLIIGGTRVQPPPTKPFARQAKCTSSCDPGMNSPHLAASSSACRTKQVRHDGDHHRLRQRGATNTVQHHQVKRIHSVSLSGTTIASQLVRW